MIKSRLNFNCNKMKLINRFLHRPLNLKIYSLTVHHEILCSFVPKSYQFINSSLIKKFLILEVLGFTKSCLWVGAIQTLSGARPQWVLQNVTKFRSIGPWVREGKFGGFGCDRDTEFLKITLNKSKSKKDRDSKCCLPTL